MESHDPDKSFLQVLRDEIGDSGADLDIPPRTDNAREIDFGLHAGEKFP